MLTTVLIILLILLLIGSFPVYPHSRSYGWAPSSGLLVIILIIILIVYVL